MDDLSDVDDVKEVVEDDSEDDSSEYVEDDDSETDNGILLNDMPIDQKLKIAERANEIYREQLKYMQDHLRDLRNLFVSKESIIENLMLRFDLGILAQDSKRDGPDLPPDEIEADELRKKAEGLAQRTVLENVELRDSIDKLREENFHLRNEIYELQDKFNRQILYINKIENGKNNNEKYEYKNSNNNSKKYYKTKNKIKRSKSLEYLAKNAKKAIKKPNQRVVNSNNKNIKVNTEKRGLDKANSQTVTAQKDEELILEEKDNLSDEKKHESDTLVLNNESDKKDNQLKNCTQKKQEVEKENKKNILNNNKTKDLKDEKKEILDRKLILLNEELNINEKILKQKEDKILSLKKEIKNNNLKDETSENLLVMLEDEICKYRKKIKKQKSDINELVLEIEEESNSAITTNKIIE